MGRNKGTKTVKDIKIDNLFRNKKDANKYTKKWFGKFPERLHNKKAFVKFLGNIVYQAGQDLNLKYPDQELGSNNYKLEDTEESIQIEKDGTADTPYIKPLKKRKSIQEKQEIRTPEESTALVLVKDPKVITPSSPETEPQGQIEDAEDDDTELPTSRAKRIPNTQGFNKSKKPEAEPQTTPQVKPQPFSHYVSPVIPKPRTLGEISDLQHQANEMRGVQRSDQVNNNNEYLENIKKTHAFLRAQHKQNDHKPIGIIFRPCDLASGDPLKANLGYLSGQHITDTALADNLKYDLLNPKLGGSEKRDPISPQEASEKQRLAKALKMGEADKIIQRGSTTTPTKGMVEDATFTGSTVLNKNQTDNGLPKFPKPHDEIKSEKESCKNRAEFEFAYEDASSPEGRSIITEEDEKQYDNEVADKSQEIENEEKEREKVLGKSDPAPSQMNKDHVYRGKRLKDEAQPQAEEEEPDFYTGWTDEEEIKNHLAKSILDVSGLTTSTPRGAYPLSVPVKQKVSLQMLRF
jgi:hypothetical protein